MRNAAWLLVIALFLAGCSGSSDAPPPQVGTSTPSPAQYTTAAPVGNHPPKAAPPVLIDGPVRLDLTTGADDARAVAVTVLRDSVIAMVAPKENGGSGGAFQFGALFVPGERACQMPVIAQIYPQLGQQVPISAGNYTIIGWNNWEKGVSIHFEEQNQNIVSPSTRAVPRPVESSTQSQGSDDERTHGWPITDLTIIRLDFTLPTPALGFDWEYEVTVGECVVAADSGTSAPVIGNGAPSDVLVATGAVGELHITIRGDMDATIGRTPIADATMGWA